MWLWSVLSNATWGLLRLFLWALALIFVEMVVAITAVMRTQFSIRRQIGSKKDFYGYTFTQGVYMVIGLQCLMFMLSAWLINHLLINACYFVDINHKYHFLVNPFALIISSVLNYVVDRKLTGFVVPGITGGIAAGKSTVTDILEKDGWVSNDADTTYHELLKKGSGLYDEIINMCGTVVLGNDGEIDMQKLSKELQEDKEGKNLQKISEISHPKIFMVMLKKLWSRTSLFGDREPSPMFLDVPLMHETKIFSFLACPIINIHCAERERYQRFKKRLLAEQKANVKVPRGGALKLDENLCRQHFDMMIKNQFSNEQRRELSDYTIENEGTLSDLNKRVKNFLKLISREEKA